MPRNPDEPEDLDDEECVPDLNTIASATCPHCGAVTTFPGFDAIYAFVCRECGQIVEITPPTQ